jgi:prolyl-tRNA synthetase
VAPFHIHLISVNPKIDDQRQLADHLYEQLQKEGFEVLYDDRAERPGVKFADSDLIGLPVRVTVGKRASEGIVEIKIRRTGETEEVHVSQLTETLRRYLS